MTILTTERLTLRPLSRRLLERLGFNHEGALKHHIWRDGERRDCEIYGLMR